MRSLLGLILLISPLVINVSCGQSAKKTAVSDGKTLEEILRQRARKPTDVLIWLKKCALECRSPDKEIAQEMSEGYQILFTISEKNAVYSKLSMEQKAQALLGQTKVRNAFLKILAVKSDREILETAYRELANPNSLYAALDVDVQKKLEATIERLKQDQSTLATSWYLKAISTPATVDSVLEVMAAYKGCLDVNKTDSQCKSAYDDLVKFYERPRCRNAFTDRAEFFGAELKRNSEYQKPVNFFGKNYYLAKKATLSASDLLEATLENLGQDQFEIWFSLKTFSNPKLLHFTEKEMKSRGSLLMSLQGKILAEAPVMQKITDGQFRMPFPNAGQAKEAFEKICKAPSHDEVPENLKLVSK